jgi:hypothetical protein
MSLCRERTLTNSSKREPHVSRDNLTLPSLLERSTGQFEVFNKSGLHNKYHSKLVVTYIGLSFTQFNLSTHSKVLSFHHCSFSISGHFTDLYHRFHRHPTVCPLSTDSTLCPHADSTHVCMWCPYDATSFKYIVGWRSAIFRL